MTKVSIQPDSSCLTVCRTLSHLYKTKLFPLESTYRYHELNEPKMEDSDFDSRASIMLIGQYSVGKTSFIRYLLGQDYPSMRIGPEPTTDGFVVITKGDSERIIPGNALVVDNTKPFKAFSSFGNNFLNRFQCAEVNNELLDGLTIVDTPGILAGEKQSIQRGYDFAGVVKLFAERVDRIILLFDAHKLDISDEFRACLEAIRAYDIKIRVVLNKADSVNAQQLMRVYGALMWFLGRIIHTPEVIKVYIGSFWESPLMNDYYRKLFELESNDLFEELKRLPANSTLRKLNDFIRRSRSVIINAHIVGALHRNMPLFGKDKYKEKCIVSLKGLFAQLTQELSLSIGDFPRVETLQERLKLIDFAKLKSLNAKLVSVVQVMLNTEVSRLMDMIPDEEARNPSHQTLRGGIFNNSELSGSNSVVNPFMTGGEEGVSMGMSSGGWIVDSFRDNFDKVFDSLVKEDGKVRGDIAKVELLKTKLPSTSLAKIWRLSDIDKDGRLDKDEWALCMYLCQLKLNNHEIPNDLPPHLIPVSKR